MKVKDLPVDMDKISGRLRNRVGRFEISKEMMIDYISFFPDNLSMKDVIIVECRYNPIRRTYDIIGFSDHFKPCLSSDVPKYELIIGTDPQIDYEFKSTEY